MSKSLLTQQLVREWFNYDPLTGIVTWRKRNKFTHRVSVGDRAGSCQYHLRDGSPARRKIAFQRKNYNEASIIWLWMTGKWPRNEIDHIDNNPFNNIWSNLREATNRQNGANRATWRKAQLRWTYVASNGKFKSAVKSNGIIYYVGTFDTEQQAHDAAYALAKQLHKQFVRRV